MLLHYISGADCNQTRAREGWWVRSYVMNGVWKSLKGGIYVASWNNPGYYAQFELSCFNQDLFSAEKQLPCDTSSRAFFPREGDYDTILKHIKTKKTDKSRGDINTLREYCRRWILEGHNVYFNATPRNVSIPYYC